MNTHYIYEIKMGRFEFDHVHLTESLSSSEIFDWYLETDRSNEEIIYSCGDHLTADGEYCNVYDKAQTTYDRGRDALTGYVVFLQCAEYDDDDNELVQAYILRSYAEPVNID